MDVHYGSTVETRVASCRATTGHRHRLIRLIASLGALFLTLALLTGCPNAAGPDGNANDNAGNMNDNAGNTNDNVGNTNDNDSGVTPGVEIAIPNEGAEHVAAGTQVEYAANPPASGSHWSSADPPAPVEPGFYVETLEEEQWVHNIEHGHVVILYDCKGDCDEALLSALADFFDAAPPSETFDYAKLVIAPYDGLPFALTAVAWDVQLHLEAFDADSLLAFIEKYQDEGPESAP